MARAPEEAGATAETPAELGWTAWKAIARRVWAGTERHNLGLMSAGVAFYAFLSFVPMLGALVMTYGLVADPATVMQHMRIVIDLVPREAAELIYEQLVSLTNSAAGKKGLGLFVALVVAIYGATRASGAIMTAMNAIYGEEDRRGFIGGTLTSIALIVAALIIGIGGIFAASMLGYAQALLGGLGAAGVFGFKIITWIAAGLLCCITIGGIYRFAPDREDARWAWLSLGSAIATVLWLGATLGFGAYAASFGNYGATYGSLGAVVVLLMWLYVSAYAILLGGLINAEAEHQTACDTTTGAEQPMGERGAVMADTSAALSPAHDMVTA